MTQQGWFRGAEPPVSRTGVQRLFLPFAPGVERLPKPIGPARPDRGKLDLFDASIWRMGRCLAALPGAHDGSGAKQQPGQRPAAGKALAGPSGNNGSAG